MIGAIQRQIEKLAYAHTSFFSNEPMEALADTLIARAPKSFDKVYFVSGGSEAIEAALKIARQYFVEKGEPQRAHVIARRQTYHGNTLGALAVGGNDWRRAVRAAADQDDACFALLRLSRQERRRNRRRLRRAPGGRARRRDQRLGHEKALSRSSPRPWSAQPPVRSRRSRLLQARARDLRPLRRAADPRRGDVRHGPHRHAAGPASRKASCRT